MRVNRATYVWILNMLCMRVKERKNGRFWNFKWFRMPNARYEKPKFFISHINLLSVELTEYILSFSIENAMTSFSVAEKIFVYARLTVDLYWIYLISLHVYVVWIISLLLYEYIYSD